MTIPIAVAFTGATLLVSIVGSYFTSQIQTQAQVNEVRTDLSKDITMDRENIAALKEAVDTIKDQTKQTQTDVKEILRLIK